MSKKFDVSTLGYRAEIMISNENGKISEIRISIPYNFPIIYENPTEKIISEVFNKISEISGLESILEIIKVVNDKEIKEMLRRIMLQKLKEAEEAVQKA
jgi:hypothetical protein